MKSIYIYLSVIAIAMLPTVYNAKASKTQSTSPQFFMQNKGQVTDQYGKPRFDIAYKLTTDKGLSIFIGTGQLHYQWSIYNTTKNQDYSDQKFNNNTSTSVDMYRMDVVLVGANMNAPIIEELPNDFIENYYLPQCPNGAVAHSYRKITFKNIYPHIDWVLYPKDGGLEYDFILHPGGHSSDIRLRYDGSSSLFLKKGALIAATPMGQITEHAPYCYSAATKQNINSAYHLEGHTLSFSIDNTESISDDIVIDPKLNWACYMGGTSIEEGNQVATDTAGNVYISGETTSSNNIATSGAFKTVYSASYDMFLTKFNINGTKKWGTYYGGNYSDFCFTMAIDKTGNIFIGGCTDNSTGLASTGAYQTTINLKPSLYHPVLAKFDSLGSRLWATYYGDTLGGDIRAMTCDNTGNIYFGSGGSGLYVTGNYPYATTGSFQPNGGDGYIAKFGPGGNRIWGTYFNGDVRVLACDVANNLIVSGTVKTNTNISTAGAFQSTGVSLQSFLTKFSSGGVRLWGTYLPYNYMTAMVCDPSNNIYIGNNETAFGLATSGAYQTTLGGGDDGLVAKFSPAGQRIWVTYIGGTADEYVTGINISTNGDLSISGITYFAGTSIATPNAYHTTSNANVNNGDFFMAQLSPDGAKLKYATYYGGTADESSGFSPWSKNAIAYNRNYNKIYLGGTTASASQIAYGGVGQTSLGGSEDAFVVQFNADTSVYIKEPFIDTALCVGDTITIPYGITQHFRSGNTFTLQMSNSSGSFASPITLTSVVADTAGVLGFRVPTITLAMGYKLRIVSTMPIDTSNVNEYPIHIGGVKAANPSASSNAPVCYNGTLNLSSSTTSSGAGYTWIGPNGFYDLTQNPVRTNISEADTGFYIVQINIGGCAVKDTVNVSIKPNPAKPSAGSNSPVCPGTTLNLTGSTTTGGVTYSWTGPNGFSATTQNPSKANAVFADSGKYVLTVTLNGCTAKDTTHVVTQILTPTPSASSNSPICTGGTISLSASAVTGATYSWTGPTGFTSTGQTTTRPFAGTADAGTYSVTANVGGCVSLPGTVSVVVNQGPLVNIFPHPSLNICVGDSITLVAIPVNVGPNPSYQWYKNNSLLGGQTGTSFTDLSPADKDSFYVTVTVPTGICTSSISNLLTINVTPVSAGPVTTIASSPNTNIWPGLNVQFSISSMANQGSAPIYQWMRNSKSVIGATNNTWGATTLQDKDTVCLLLTSSNVCARPKSALSNCIVMNIATGIEKVSTDVLSIYPNPNHGNFTIESKEAGTLYLYSITGQLVASYSVSKGKTNINLDGSLSAGNYTGRFVTAENRTYDLKITLE